MCLCSKTGFRWHGFKVFHCLLSTLLGLIVIRNLAEGSIVELRNLCQNQLGLQVHGKPATIPLLFYHFWHASCRPFQVLQHVALPTVPNHSGRLRWVCQLPLPCEDGVHVVVRWDDELQPLIGDNKKVTIPISLRKFKLHHISVRVLIAGQRHAKKSCGKRYRSRTSRPTNRPEGRLAGQEEPSGECRELASIVEKITSLAVFARGLPFRFIHTYMVFEYLGRVDLDLREFHHGLKQAGTSQI